MFCGSVGRTCYHETRNAKGQLHQQAELTFPFFLPTNPSENLFAIFFFKGRSLAYHNERKKDNNKKNNDKNSSKTSTDSDADHELAAGYSYNACLKFRLP